MKKIIFILCIFVAISSQAQEKKELDNLDFIAGTWIMAEKNGAKTIESWEAKNHNLKGYSVSLNAKGDTTFSEELCIRKFGKHWCYVAALKDHVTLFKITKKENSYVRFENKEHDFPQYVEYTRKNDSLFVSIGKLNSSKKIDFVYKNKAD